MKKIPTVVTVRIVTALFVILYIIFAGIHMNAPLVERESPSGIISQPEEAFKGLINVWNINGFKPYSGSFASILNSAAKDMEKKYFGVYYEVISMSLDEYAERLNNGEMPDIISFPCGACYEEQFIIAPNARLLAWAEGLGDSRGVTLALPYAASGYVIAANLDRCYEKQYELKKELTLSDICVEGELAGNVTIAAVNGVEAQIAPIEDFTAGKAMFAICDMAKAGDVARTHLNKGGFEIKLFPLGGYTDEVQLIGITKALAKEKHKYASAFIECLLSEKKQAGLIKHGLFPTVECEESMEDVPDMLKNAFPTKLIAPNAFEYRKHASPLEAAAQRAVAGDESAKNDVRLRLLELVKEE